MDTQEHYYKLLGVTPESSAQEINQAYVHALAQLHPDRLSDEPRRQKRARERVREINEAYGAIKGLHLSPGTPSSSPEDGNEAGFPPPSPRATAWKAVESADGRKPFGPGRLLLLGLLAVPLAISTVHLFVSAPTSPPAASPAASIPAAPNMAPPPPLAGPAVKLAAPEGKHTGAPAISRRVAKKEPAMPGSVPAVSCTPPPAPRQQAPAGQPDELSAAQAARIKQIAEEGDAAAQVRLGSLYFAGSGVRQDYGEAAVWYRKAADQENKAAQAWLGYLSATGKGTRQDLAEAAKWYRLAADRKDVTAEAWLGYLYATGKGVPRDFGEAAAWYRRAAEQGNATAQVWLGYLYEKGKGVPRDLGEALMWYYRAAQQGDATAQEHLARLSKGAGRIDRRS